MPPLQQRIRPSRKKSCLQCAKSKVRCDLQRPACTRCVAGKNQCKYAAPLPHGLHAPPPSGSSSQSFPSLLDVAPPTLLPEPLADRPNTASEGPTVCSESTAVQLAENLTKVGNHADAVALDFSKLDLVPLSHANQIRQRWMQPFLEFPEQNSKTFDPFTLQYIISVLRCYLRQMTEDDSIPPIIHAMQMAEPSTATPLANCFSLTRLWHHQAPMSEEVVAETIKREMDRLKCYVSFS